MLEIEGFVILFYYSLPFEVIKGCTRGFMSGSCRVWKDVV